MFIFIFGMFKHFFVRHFAKHLYSGSVKYEKIKNMIQFCFFLRFLAMLALIFVFTSSANSEIRDSAGPAIISEKNIDVSVQVAFFNDFSEEDSPYCDLCLMKRLEAASQSSSSCIQLQPGDELSRKHVAKKDRFIVRCPSSLDSKQESIEYFGIVDCSTLGDRSKVYLKDAANTKSVILSEDRDLNEDEVLKFVHPKV
jgi:hypothetical protein